MGQASWRRGRISLSSGNATSRARNSSCWSGGSAATGAVSFRATLGAAQARQVDARRAGRARRCSKRPAHLELYRASMEDRGLA
jgi:hypothetical protein